MAVAEDARAVGASSDRARARGGWIPIVLALALAAAVHLPSLGLGFVGDDYEWWLAARTALEEPSRLIAPFGGFRPANLWLLAADQLLYGTDPVGYHATSILLHLACGALLWRVLLGFGFTSWVAAGIAGLWLCSPYSLKPAQSLCERFQPLLLLAWLGLVLLWPRAGEPWSRRRGWAAALLIAATVLVKESWVIAPALVVCLELAIRRTTLRGALRSAAPVGAAVLVYVAAYSLAPPISTDYYARRLAPAAKVPHSWAVFMMATGLDPSSTQLGPAEAVAVLVIAGLAWWGWRRRCAVTATGMALFLLPFLPILTVDFLVTRYTYIPLVGFLLVVTAAARAVCAAVTARWRRLATVLIAAAGVGYLVHGLVLLRGDMHDAERRDEAHRLLLAEARAFAPELPRVGLILGVRLERDDPNRALLDRLEGVGKAYYQRTRHPYALIRWAPLFSYVLDDEGGPLYESTTPRDGEPWAVVGHRSGGFVRLPSGGATAAEAVAYWQGRGGFVEAFRARLPRPVNSDQ